MNRDEAIKRLRVYIAENFNGKQRLYAEHLNVSSAFVSAVLIGKKLPSKRMMSDIGVKKVVTVTFEEA